MKIFFVSELVKNGKTIDMLSVGMVREDGKIFHYDSSKLPKKSVDEWVKENVLLEKPPSGT